jgi:small-conductance mechanosensitive channel
MFRRWFCLLPLIVWLTTLPHEAVHSQQKPPSPAASTDAAGQDAAASHSAPPLSARPEAATPFDRLSPAQARAALETLNDPRKRAEVTATLEAIARTQPEAGSSPPANPPDGTQAPSATPAPSTTPAPSAAPAPSTAAAPAAAAKPASPVVEIQLAPNGLGAQVLLAASSFLNNTANEVSRAARTIQSVPLLFGWTVAMLTNPLGQQMLIDTGWRLAVNLAVALGVWLALRLLSWRPMTRVLNAGRRIEPHEQEDAVSRAERGATEPPSRRRDVNLDRLGRRIRLGLARFGLRMVPVAGLLIAGHIAVASLGGPPDSRLVILAVLEAIVASQTLLALLTLLFEPDPSGLQLLPLRPSAGAYLVRWGRRLILIAVPGYTIGVVAQLLGLSVTAHDALEKIVRLALTICLGVIVVQRRRQVRRWLSAPPGAPPGTTGVLLWLRNGLARSWHWIALFFLTATWLAWTLGAPDAFARIMWYFATTVTVVLVAAMARTAVLAILGSRETAVAPGATSVDGSAATPVNALKVRLSVYHPAIRQLATALIDVLALLVVSQLYGVGGLTWLLTSAVGQRIVSGFVTLVVTIALAFAIWEGANIAIQSHLESLRRGAQAARSARLLTLLPLIRTTLAITVAVVAGLMVLSEIGVNIAPLLAGAGIVGVAIGFGSQKLVQDVITGVFLLLENTMQVGDVVKVGDQSGVVESLSVRTIRLRTEDGSVVVMPFSAVTTVLNMTRDYSRAVILVNIFQGEDVDRVTEELRAIVREMREEEAWSAVILDELEVWGLDRITDTALQIKCRIMCTPFGRWNVGREFNRRLKTRFEFVAVAVANSALKLMSAEPASQQAASPPAEAASQREEAAARSSAPAEAGQ